MIAIIEYRLNEIEVEEYEMDAMQEPVQIFALLKSQAIEGKRPTRILLQPQRSDWNEPIYVMNAIGFVNTFMRDDIDIVAECDKCLKHIEKISGPVYVNRDQRRAIMRKLQVKK